MNTHPDWTGGLAVLVGLAVIAAYVYGAEAAARLRVWWAAKRLRWAMEKARVDAVARGWVPTPEQVGLAPAAEEEREGGPDDCELCVGNGMYAVRMAGVPDRASFVNCPSCSGTGERTWRS